MIRPATAALAAAPACALLGAAPAPSQAQAYPQIPGPGGSLVPPSPVIAFPQSSANIVTVPIYSLGATPAVLDPAQTRRSYLHISNPAAPGGPAFSCTENGTTPVLYAGGVITLQPGQYYTEEGAAVENGPITCVAGAAGAAITVKVLDQ